MFNYMYMDVMHCLVAFDRLTCLYEAVIRILFYKHMV